MNRVSGNQGTKSLIRNVLVVSMLGIGAAVMAAPSDRCEVVFADSQAAVLRADPVTGSHSIVSRDNKLMQPFGIAGGQTGEYFVSDTGCGAILGIDPSTGNQRVISCGGSLGVPFGIAVERTGTILVANGQSILRVNPITGAQTILSSANIFRVPLTVTVADNDDIYVADALGPIVRVSPSNGAQTLVSSGGYLQRPQGIAVKGKNIYVTDVAGGEMNYGIGRVLQIDKGNGSQTILSEGNNLVGPVGISVMPTGDLIVGDPYTINPESADILDGAIIRVDKNNGEQKVISRGSDVFVNPRGVAVVPSTAN